MLFTAVGLLHLEISYLGITHMEISLGLFGNPNFISAFLGIFITTIWALCCAEDFLEVTSLVGLIGW
jgi:hypothetical protein